MQRISLLLTLCMYLIVTADAIAEAGPPAAYTKEHVITIDATILHPPSWWYVPGVTPLIWSMDPENTEAYRTSAVRELKLKPGSYRFGTFTFDFPFTVNLDGVLEFSTTLDQCVSGRGTQKLTIRCSRTQPYGGQPEYIVK
jgi:hypothetical protein